ncbi:hypothetical protein [Anabaena azotica]|uniref:hypothetical protein n=1 Tax=Anabaena azotica TaxID=197653 RepID=UPI0039A5B5E9
MIVSLKTAIAPPNIPQQAIALPHPKSDRTPNIPKSDRTPTPQKRSHSHTPKAIASPHPKSDSYGLLRYRTPNISKSDTFGKLTLTL